MIVKEVVTQIRPQGGHDRGQVTTGYYTIEGNTLTMTAPDGSPIEGYAHELKPGENEKAIAGVLTKKIRAAFMNEQVPGFSRELRYSNQGIA